MYNAHMLNPSLVAVAIAHEASKSRYYNPTHKEKNMSGFFEPLHRKVIAGILAALVFVLLIASCTPRQPVAYMQQPTVVQQAPAVVGAAPVVVAPQHHNAFGEAFAGSMLGSMVGNSFGRNSSTTVIERHATTPPVTTTAPAQRYATPTPSYRPPVTQSYQNSRGVQSTVITRPSASGRTSISVGKRR